MHRKMTGVLGAAFLATACAHGGVQGGKTGGETVSDADFGRLQAGQTGPVDEARQFLASARDESARAKLRLQQMQQEDDLAKADQQVADADAKRAEAQVRLANENREPAALESARKMTESAKIRHQAADARLDYANQLAAARQASVKAAERQVALGEARVEWAKLQALQQAGVPAATKYDAGGFQTRLNDAQKDFDTSMQKARELETQSTAAQQRWQDLQRQVQSPSAASTG